MGGGLLLGLGGLATRFLQFLYPEIKPIRQREILVAAEEDIPLNRAQTLHIFEHRVIVRRTEEGVRAFSARCPHLGCYVQWDTMRQQFVCPCHQGVFDSDGNVISGPPPRPLDEFQVTVKNKNVFVTVPTTA